MSTPSQPQPAPQPQPQPQYQAAPQPVYQSPTVPYQPPAPAPVPSTKTTMGDTNTFAVLSIIFAFSVPLMAIILGHMGLGQIRRTGDAGRGLALTGLIIGYVSFVLVALFFILYFGVILIAIAAASEAASSPSYY